jgi:hypothetical protein
MTVEELLERMSSAEMTAWRALYQIEADERKRASEMARQKNRMKR